MVNVRIIFQISYLALYISFVLIAGLTYGFQLFLTSNLFLIITALIGVTIFALYFGIRIPKTFQNMVDKTREILRPEVYKEYVKYVKKKFNSKLELFLPILFSFVVFTIISMPTLIFG